MKRSLCLILVLATSACLKHEKKTKSPQPQADDAQGLISQLQKKPGRFSNGEDTFIVQADGMYHLISKINVREYIASENGPTEAQEETCVYRLQGNMVAANEKDALKGQTNLGLTKLEILANEPGNPADSSEHDLKVCEKLKDRWVAQGHAKVILSEVTPSYVRMSYMDQFESDREDGRKQHLKPVSARYLSQYLLRKGQTANLTERLLPELSGGYATSGEQISIDQGTRSFDLYSKRCRFQVMALVDGIQLQASSLQLKLKQVVVVDVPSNTVGRPVDCSAYDSIWKDGVALGLEPLKIEETNDQQNRWKSFSMTPPIPGYQRTYERTK